MICCIVFDFIFPANIKHFLRKNNTQQTDLTDFKNLSGLNYCFTTLWCAPCRYSRTAVYLP